MADYSEFSDRVLISHKLADAYGWNYQEIWGTESPAPTLEELKQHLKLLDTLERDENRFMSRVEAAIHKIALKIYGKKN